MATVTKTELFNKIREYNESNERKCPSKELIKMFGKLTVVERKSLENLIKSLKDSGDLLSKKGRGGGLYLAGPVDNTEIESKDESENEDLLDASPVEASSDDQIEIDNSDESYQKLMDMVTGKIDTDEQWMKENWPDAYQDMMKEDDLEEEDVEEEVMSVPF